MRISKKILAIALSILMAVSMMPFTVFADEVPEGTTYSYTTLKGATSYKTAAFPTTISSSGTYTLYQDVTRTTYLVTGVLASDVTVDLNGHDITVPSNSRNAWINCRSNSSWKFINTSSTPSNIIIGNDGPITGANASVTIGEGVTVKPADEATNVTPLYIDKTATGAKINIDGTIESTADTFAITVNGSIAQNENTAVTVGPTGVVKGGVAGIYAAGYANYTINGTVTGDTAIYQKGGNLVVNEGAVVTATGDKAAYAQNGNGMSATGDAIVVEDNASYNLGTTEIKGGTITSTAEGTSTIAEYDADNVSTEPEESRQDIEVITGTFVSAGAADDVSEYTKDPNATQNATTGKVTTTSVVRIGDTFYTNVDLAVADVPTNNTPVTITFIKDVSISGRGGPKVQAGQNITLDLDGHSWNLRAPVGSTGTVTNGMQLLQGSTVTIKNGRVYTNRANIMTVIQNYGDLTIENATVEFTGSNAGRVAVSTNSSNTVIKNSTIAVKNAGLADMPSYAISVTPGWGGYTDASIVIEDSDVKGNMEVDSKSATSTVEVEFKGNTTLEGDIVIPDDIAGAMEVKSTSQNVAAPEGYEWLKKSDGTDILVDVVNNEAIVDGVPYATFEEALAAISTVTSTTHSKADDPTYEYKTYVANGTITLLKDVDGNGLIIGSGSDLTVDFNGHTYNVAQNPVGSNGTETAGLQSLKNSDITFKNGTFTSDSADVVRLIQNYANLTLDNMTVNQKGYYLDQNTISNANGTLTIKDSTVEAPDFTWLGWSDEDAADSLGAEAFTAGTFSSYTDSAVVVTGDSTINGNVSVDIDNAATANSNTVTFESGTVNGDIKMNKDAVSAVVTTNAATQNGEVPAGYYWNAGVLTPVIDGASVTVDSTISANIYVNVDAYVTDTANTTIEVTYNNADELDPTQINTVTETYNYADLATATDAQVAGDKIVSIVQAPAQMDDALIINVKENGEVKHTLTTTVADYCVQLGAGDDANAALARAMYDYGKAAYETTYADNVSYAGKEEGKFAEPYFNTAAPTFPASTIAKTNAADYGFVSVALVATSTPSFRAYTNLTEEQAYKLDLGVNNSSANIKVNEDNGMVLADFGAIKPEDFDVVKTATIGDASVSASVLDYARLAYEGGSTDLGRSIYNYYAAADAIWG